MSERMNSEQFRKAHRKAARERLENILADALIVAGGTCAMFTRPPCNNFCQDRKWQADFMWHFALCASRKGGVKHAVKLLVEVEGGTWTRGRHTRPRGFQSDCEKYNAAAERGWIVLRYTSEDITKRLPSVVAQIRRVLER